MYSWTLFSLSFSLSGNYKGWKISDINLEDIAPAGLVESLVAYGLTACLLYLSCYMRGESIYILSETLESVNVGYSALRFFSQLINTSIPILQLTS